MNLKERSIKLKTEIPAVYLALRKEATPLPARICAWVTIVYALSPIDLIPDFIPVLGYLDDLVILPILLVLTVNLIPDEILEECRIESKGFWKSGKRGRWFYSLPIVFIWLFALILILRSIWF